jgi:antitoxin component YwqK of YwqJK toxin-antitoxin module
MRYWYPNQTLQQERFFAAGKNRVYIKAGGPMVRLSLNIPLVKTSTMAVKEWYTNGMLFRVFHYNMGHEEGCEQMWWENGTVRANYVVKDGQQYGLIGRKLCRNLIK